MKRCSACKISKDISMFHSNISNKDSLSNQCKDCHNKGQRKYLIGSYGLTNDQFQYLLDKQDNRCGICQKEFSFDNRPVIDHDHTCCPSSISRNKGKISNGRSVTSCGKCVRGLLCTSCNVGLGMFDDNFQRVISAVNYLKVYIPDLNLEDNLSLETL